MANGKQRIENRQLDPRRFSVISFKTITAVCLGATLCAAQTINISGVVQDSGGVGIVGATVKLEKANVTTTSGAGGVFTLSDSATSAKPFCGFGSMSSNLVQFRNGKVTFTVSGNTSVGISIHDVGGRQLFMSKTMHGLGKHSIDVPLQPAGVFLCKVAIGHESYSFKTSTFGASSMQQGVVSGGTWALARQGKAGAVIDDVIAATSPGMLNYRCVIGNSDTSGVVIEMQPNAGDVTDADGNVYQSVRIGDQVWTVENLKTTKYNDGTPISHVPDPAAWYNLYTTGSTTGAYCYYDNNTANKAKYGALYNWHAVNTGKLAPAGWHVPTDAEWTQLEEYLIANGYNYDGSTSGKKIGKSLAAKTDWSSCSMTGNVGNDLTSNNSTGFSALPGGFRSFDGNFHTQSYHGFWWSATERTALHAYTRNLPYASNYLLIYLDYKKYGYSVRLVRDLD